MNRDSQASANACSCVALLFLLNITIGTLCFQYVLDVVFGVDAPFYLDIIGGIVTGEFVIPCSIVCWIVTMCGVSTPWIG